MHQETKDNRRARLQRIRNQIARVQAGEGGPGGGEGLIGGDGKSHGGSVRAGEWEEEDLTVHVEL